MYIYMLLIFVVVLFLMSFYYPREALTNPFEDDNDPCIMKEKYTPFVTSELGYSNENNAIQKNYESILRMTDYNQYKRTLDPSCRL